MDTRAEVDMKYEKTKVIARFAEERKRTLLYSIFALTRSSGAPSLRWQLHSTPQQIHVRQREGREQARRILRRSAVANFAITPPALDHVEKHVQRGPEQRSGDG
jgi:hypothetical protein